MPTWENAIGTKESAGLGKLLVCVHPEGAGAWRSAEEVPAIAAVLDALNGVLPVGGFLPYDGPPAIAAPLYLCNGQEVAGATVPILAAEWGTGGSSRWGAAASGKVKIPNFAGKTLFGANGGSLVIGATGGAENVALTTAQILKGVYYTGSSGYVRSEPGPNPGVAYGPIDRTGGTPGDPADSHQNMPPYAVVRGFIVRGY